MTGSSHVVLDIAGWFGPGAGGLLFQQRAATRLLDTRSASASPVQSEQAVNVTAVSVLNVASTESAAQGFVTARPCGSNATSSLIDTTPGENTANVTAVGPGTSGATCIQASVPSHLVVDQFAVFVP